MMVDRSDLDRVDELNREYQAIERGLDNLANGGRIISMTISGGNPPAQPAPGQPIQPFRVAVTLSTVLIDYPAQMVASIQQQLEGRKTAINAEFARLGVTGAAAAMAAAAPMAAAVAPRAQPPRVTGRVGRRG